MSEWMTVTVHNSGLQQRVRKSSIIAYGTDNRIAYIVRSGGPSMQVRQTEAELKGELEGD